MGFYRTGTGTGLGKTPHSRSLNIKRGKKTTVILQGIKTGIKRGFKKERNEEVTTHRKKRNH